MEHTWALCFHIYACFELVGIFLHIWAHLVGLVLACSAVCVCVCTCACACPPLCVCAWCLIVMGIPYEEDIVLPSVSGLEQLFLVVVSFRRPVKEEPKG
jgi:hypothetical protein